MKHKISKIIITIIIGLFSTTCLSPALTSLTFAKKPATCSQPDVSEAIKEADGCYNNEDEIQSIITGILNAVILVSGLVSVAFVIVGGINYMTSTGDSGKVEKAKKTIIYALIGLAVCVLAFAIVNWVIVSALKQG